MQKRGHKHGMHRTPIWWVWINLRKRCYKPKAQNYKWYGGRGIKVCDRWLNSFNNFYEDMGDKPSSKHSIDRINNDGNYCKRNCRWATQTEQHNNKSSNRIILYKNKKRTASQLAEEFNIHQQVIRNRIKSGWKIEDVLTTPVRKKKIYN